jgi:hypothetical protein
MPLLRQLATLFTERHPSLRFQLVALSSDQILGRLNQNQFDVSIPILSVDQAYFASLPLGATRLLHDRRHFRFPGACDVGRRWRSFRSPRCGAACIFGNHSITRCAVAA